MSEFLKRTLFGALYVCVIVLSVTLSVESIFLLVVLFSIIGYTEMKQLLRERGGVFTSSMISILLMIVASAVDWYNSEEAPTSIAPAFVAGFILMLTEHIRRSSPEDGSSQLGNSILTTVYLGLPLAVMPWFTQINPYPDHRPLLGVLDYRFDPMPLLGLFILIWANDTFAYLIGKSIGKHPLHSRLSPKKSVEGFIGGLIFAGAAGYILSLFSDSLSLTDWLIFAVLAGAGGTLGDLLESSFKRVAGVKDSGKLIPGHGGLLDRIDSILFAVPLTGLYLWIQF